MPVVSARCACVCPRTGSRHGLIPQAAIPRAGDRPGGGDGRAAGLPASLGVKLVDQFFDRLDGVPLVAPPAQRAG